MENRDIWWPRRSLAKAAAEAAAQHRPIVRSHCQTGLVSFSKADISRTTGTWQVPVVLLISTFENGTKPVWHSFEVGSVNALLVF